MYDVKKKNKTLKNIKERACVTIKIPLFSKQFLHEHGHHQLCFYIFQVHTILDIAHCKLSFLQYQEESVSS